MKGIARQMWPALNIPVHIKGRQKQTKRLKWGPENYSQNQAAMSY